MKRDGDRVVGDLLFGLSTFHGTFLDALHQFSGYRYLTLRLLAEAYADGVADALGQQCANAYSTLDAAVLTFAGLGDTQVQRIVHILAVHLLDQQPYRLHHHDGVAGFDGDDHVVEPLALADTQELQTALHDAGRCVAVARHDTIRQRAVVHTDADGGVVLLTDVEKRYKPLINFPQFGLILLVGIFQLFERTCRIDIVSRVHAHLLAIAGCHIGDVRIEMHVGDQWCCVAVGFQALRDMLHVHGLACALSGEPHQFSASIDDSLRLTDTRLGVVGVGSGHRLDADGMAAANHYLPYTCLGGHSSLVAHSVGLVFVVADGSQILVGFLNFLA